MSPLTNSQLETLIKRIAFAKTELKDLESFKTISFQIFQDDRLKRRNVERIIENIFNSASDIAKVILAGENVEIPETYREAFLALDKLGVIPRDIAVKMAEFCRLRNVLAHQYLDIKWELIENFLKTGLQIANSFLEAIERAMNSK